MCVKTRHVQKVPKLQLELRSGRAGLESSELPRKLEWARKLRWARKHERTRKLEGAEEVQFPSRDHQGTRRGFKMYVFNRTNY